MRVVVFSTADTYFTHFLGVIDINGRSSRESAHLFNKLRLLFLEKLVKLCPGQKRNEAYSS